MTTITTVTTASKLADYYIWFANDVGSYLRCDAKTLGLMLEVSCQKMNLLMLLLRRNQSENFTKAVQLKFDLAKETGFFTESVAIPKYFRKKPGFWAPV
jgi:hypothetical protein